MKAIAIPLLVVSLSLTACGKGASFGFSSEKATSSESSGDASIKSDDTTSASKTSTNTTSMSADYLINAAVSNYLAAHDESKELAKARKNALMYVHQSQNARSLKTLAQISEGLSKNHDPAVSSHRGALIVLKASGTPIQGWPIEGFNTAAQRSYAITVYTVGMFANDLKTEIARDLVSADLENPVQAQSKIIKKIGSISSETLEGLWKQAQQSAPKDDAVVLNFSGKQETPVSFNYPDGIAGVGGSGIVISQNGIKNYFGGGNLSGKAYQLSLATALSVASTDTLSLNNKDGSTSSNVSKSSASTNSGQ